jgi:glycosyltransferase involved in cell wall biosynthesis
MNTPVGGFRTLSLRKNSFLGMPDYAGGPLVKILGASHEVRREVKGFDLVHFPDSTYGAFIRHPRLVLTIWGYYSWRLYPRWYAERFGFPINIPGTLAGFQFMMMNTLALRSARAIVSLLPLEYLPEGQIRENLYYIPPPLTVTENLPGEHDSRCEIAMHDARADIVFIFASRDLSIIGKGGQLAIDAFTKLALHHRVSASLLMVGGNEHALNVPNAVRHKVTFTGFLARRDYLRFLGPGHCFLALSHGEELDYACLEAMASGCSVIASDIPAHYVVKDHETGIVVTRNIDSVCSAMLELADNNVRSKLGKNAASKIRQLTDPIEVARRYVTMYQRMLSN